MGTAKDGVPAGMPELLNYLAENEMSIPDELTRYLLRSAGVDMRDEAALRMVSLAAHKFVATLLSDAYLLRKQKADKSRTASKSAKQALQSSEGMTLTTEDVASVLEDAGVHVQQQLMYTQAKHQQAPNQQ